jgi:hypothetical protein
VHPSSLQLQGSVRGGVGTEKEEVLEVVGDAEDNGIATASSGAGSSKTQLMVMFAVSLASRVLSSDPVSRWKPAGLPISLRAQVPIKPLLYSYWYSAGLVSRRGIQ